MKKYFVTSFNPYNEGKHFYIICEVDGELSEVDFLKESNIVRYTASTSHIVYLDPELEKMMETKNENGKILVRWKELFPSKQPSNWFEPGSLWINDSNIVSANSPEEAVLYFKLNSFK